MTIKDILPDDRGATLVGRVWRKGHGPCVVAVRDGQVFDVTTRDAPTMRDLGTPVYPVRFFAALMAACGADARIVVVRVRGVPAAAGLLVRHGACMEVPWAASARAFRADAVNMRLYWELLRHSVESGCTQFDFGRSTVDAGTYRFKAQWGARPVQLHWLYPLVPAGAAPAAPGSGRAVQVAQAVWTRLPTPVANAVGGFLSPGLPW